MAPIAIGKSLVKKGLVSQIVCALLIIALSSLLYNWAIGVAVAMGVLISIIPSACFSFYAFRFSGARQSRQVMQSFNHGSKIKLFITISLFVMAFAVVKVEPLPVFLSYIAITAVQWAVFFSERKI